MAGARGARERRGERHARSSITPLGKDGAAFGRRFRFSGYFLLGGRATLIGRELFETVIGREVFETWIFMRE
jgi:hypothetical protein